MAESTPISQREVPERLGFNVQLLSSKPYVFSKLQALTDRNVMRMKQVYVKQRHARFRESFSYHLPFGTKSAYVKEMMAADLDKLAKLIRICGFLMQTKTYLFWKKKTDEQTGCHSCQPKLALVRARS